MVNISPAFTGASGISKNKSTGIEASTIPPFKLKVFCRPTLPFMKALKPTSNSSILGKIQTPQNF